MNESTVFHRLSSLSDATRARLLLVLESHELTVSELCRVVQLPQSTVSRHLRILSDEGWLSSRAEGTRRHYSVSGRLEPGAERLWGVVRESLSASPEAGQDEARARDVLAGRRTRSQEFFSSAAGRWDAVRAELFGARPELHALLALLDRGWVVGDLGCGTGRLAETVAPYVRRVVGVDESSEMLEAARVRLAERLVVGEPREANGAGRGRVELRSGRLEALPLEDATLDVAVLALVLHYVPEPGRALKEAARVLRAGGRLLVVDMAAHGREEYRERMGHLWQGFERTRMEAWLSEVGLGHIAWHALPPDPEAKGPLLFAAVASKIERPR